jgi:hypothetical protein
MIRPRESWSSVANSSATCTGLKNGSSRMPVPTCISPAWSSILAAIEIGCGVARLARKWLMTKIES